MSELPKSETIIDTRPMGPLEKGDQALVDAMDNVATGDFNSGQSNKHKPGRGVYANIIGSPGILSPTRTNIVEAGVMKRNVPVIGKRYHSGVRANIAPDKIAVELYDTPDVHNLNERDVMAVHNNEVSNDGVNWVTDREQAQEAKVNAAQRIESAQHHLARIGIDTTVQH